MKSDHFIDWVLMERTFHENITSSIQFQYAWPPAYGEENYRSSLEFFNNLKRKKSGGDVQILRFEGSHHFHMIDPEKTSSNILEFLKPKQEDVNNPNNTSK